MLRKIRTQQLIRGMYVHKLCGSWLDHPFWKQAFLVVDDRQLATIRASAVSEAWIDTGRGLDLPIAPEAMSDDQWLIATALLTDVDVGVEVNPEPEPDDLRPTAFADELARAGRIVAQGRSAMPSLFGDARMGNAIDAEHCLPLVHDITRSIHRNPAAIVSLARLKTSDDYTYMHSVAVCALMISLARQLGMSDEDIRDCGVAGLVHDIGKMSIPEAILKKPGALTDDEYETIRTHPESGFMLLQEANGVGPVALDVCLHHHEKMDGSGYPEHLKGDALSTFARMGAVCDVYDAITSNRAYKPGWDPSLSIRRMAQWSREGHFDERVFQAFVRCVGIYPVGSLVRLSSERIAVVVEPSRESLLKPKVRAILDVDSLRRCAPELIDLAAPDTDERIVSRESADTWGLTDVDDLWRSSTP